MDCDALARYLLLGGALAFALGWLFMGVAWQRLRRANEIMHRALALLDAVSVVQRGEPVPDQRAQPD